MTPPAGPPPTGPPPAGSPASGSLGRTAERSTERFATGREARRAAAEAPGSARRWRLVRAHTDAVPPSVRRFMRRARQRRLRAALPWALGAGILVMAGLLGWVIYGTSVLSVRQVKVTGTELLSPTDVREAAAVRDWEPLARVDLDAVRDRVSSLAPVDRVQVRRGWPSALVIQVQERIAVAAVPQANRFVLVDDDGVAFQTLDDHPAHLPLAKVAQPGPKDVNTRAALQVLAALSPELRQQLVSITVTAPARIRIQLAKGREIIWGDATENDTKARVATALLSQRGTTIDVSAPDVVTIR